MELTAEQKQTVAKWIEEGAKLSEIQQRLGESFDVRLTYMETRFLIDDLKLQLKDTPAPEGVPAEAPILPEPGAASAQEEVYPPEPFGEPAGTGAGAGAGGGVALRVDTITRPGSVISGQVSFSDGKKAAWYLDQMGRLGLTPEEDGYRPSQGDVMAFQQALQREIAKMGY